MNIKLNFFSYPNNQYVIVPTGNHVADTMILTNEVGKEICEKKYLYGQSMEEIVENISLKYDVEKDKLFSDFNGFINTLDKVFLKSKLPSIEGPDKTFSIERQLNKWHYEQKLPYNVFFELTYNCNLRCPHCYLQDNLTYTSPYIEKEKVFEVIDDLEKLQTVYLTFTGGEATMHPDIVEILQYATSKHMLVTLLTNGQLLTDELLKKLMDIPLYNIRVSVYGDEQLHDSFVNKKGAFSQVKKVLTVLQKEKGIGVGTYVLTKLNCDKFKSVVSEFRSLGIPVQFSAMIMPTTEGDMKPTSLRIAEKETIKRIYKEAGISLSGTLCSAGVCRFRITPDGNVNPCEMMRHIIFGNINKNHFNEILASDEHKNWLAYFEKMKEQHVCNQCEKRELCSFCPGLFYEETGSFETPSPYTCLITTVKKELSENG